ncbi:MAG: ion channel [Flavobacteriaceae bacterium]|nr:ion channel [Flavobacteriaceae bacterium]
MKQDSPKKRNDGKQFRRKFIRVFVDLLAVTFPIWGSLVILVSVLGVLFALLEELSIFRGIYHAFITAMTIGYGDITPNTSLGMIISLAIGVIGMVATGIIVALAFQAVKIAFESVYQEDLTNHKKIRK